MTTIEAGNRVKKGYYFSAKSWTLQPMPKDGEALPGEAGERYVHVPLLLAFVLAPLMGAAFLMFLPFVGFYLALAAAVRPVVKLFRSSAEEVAASLQPGWAPGEAHLTGRRAEGEGEPGTPAPNAQLDSLSKEIGARRDEQKKA
ncbi:hypothetical protein [Anaeromyxobacter diazotrophicus]|uniref:Uncharacterized protein n=1 Tax=Anaeromyxobacter diazotrophicus TaxID=2590199 RepID=A0A7I9VGV9_9BACT|nr:hypothetical protein [Anaeromyxobacter diazotrophicus]GEJ55267.1 hypothetical protein AMYX_00080 [Anaeromyxobacter diazotrophicus]